MLQNILLVATPLPLLVLPLLFARRWTAQPAPASGPDPEPAHAEPRNRLFVACFVFAPLAVFAWSALKHEPRLNWTGPIWLATLPLLGWAIVHAGALTRLWLGTALRRSAGPGRRPAAGGVFGRQLPPGAGHSRRAVSRRVRPVHGLAGRHRRAAHGAGAAAARDRRGARGRGPGQVQHRQPDRLLRRAGLCPARAGGAEGDLAGDLQRQRADVQLLGPARQPGRALADPGGRASAPTWPPTGSRRTSRRWTRRSTRWRWATPGPAAMAARSTSTTTASATASARICTPRDGPFFFRYKVVRRGQGGFAFVDACARVAVR